MKRRILAALMFLIMLLSCISFTPVVQAEQSDELIDAAEKFTDIESGKWYKEAVDYVVSHELFSGMTDTRFEPNTAMNRAMFVSVLARVDGAKTSKNVKTKFSDVPSGKWYTGAVKWASDNGIVAGMSDTTFEPNTNITREQMCAILTRYAEYKGIRLTAVKDKAAFKDDNKISKWAKKSVYICQQAGIISGMTLYSFAPKDTATRAQVARILYVFHDDFVMEQNKPEPTPPSTDPVTPPLTFPVVITNDNGFIPDAEDALEKSEHNATEQSKYNFDNNPLINLNQQINREAMPSFNIDDTGFVRAGTKLADLKGKTLTFFTADNFAAWSYRNAKGETINEWQWFKDLKSELGLNIKYTVKQHQASINSALQAMNSGQACDIIYTNINVLPQALCISRSITDLVNINNNGSSPGVCKRTMDICKLGNTLRLIAPIGDVDVLWYNQTLNHELGLSDPHTMWEQGAWNWDSFRNYMLSVPKTTNDGRELVARVEWTSNIPVTWDKTNGKGFIEIVPDANVPTVKSNWLDPQVMAALEFVASINQQINYKNSSETSAGVCPEHMGLYEGTTLMSATMYTQVYRDTEYSKHIQINWVPYPKANTETGREVCQFNGHGMVLPRKTSNEKNVNYALKFMELWASRFTETIFDNLHTFEYYNFNYKQRKQYFDFVMQHVVFSPSFAGRPYYASEVGGNVLEALAGNAAYNVKTEMEKVADRHVEVVTEMMKYGN